MNTREPFGAAMRESQTKMWAKRKAADDSRSPEAGAQFVAPDFAERPGLRQSPGAFSFELAEVH
jgi:hypothetical protein